MRLPLARGFGCVPGIDSRLQVEPELGGRSERLGQSHGKGWLNPLMPVQDLAHMLSAHIEGRRQLSDTDPARLNIVRSQDRTRMARPAPPDQLFAIAPVFDSNSAHQ